MISAEELKRLNAKRRARGQPSLTQADYAASFSGGDGSSGAAVIETRSFNCTVNADVMTVTTVRDQPNVIFRVDEYGYGGCSVSLDKAALTDLRDFINMHLGCKATAAEDDGFNMYYVIGTHVRNATRTLCHSQAEAVRHAKSLMSRPGSDTTKLCVVKVDQIVERDAPPFIIRKPSASDV